MNEQMNELVNARLSLQVEREMGPAMRRSRRRTGEVELFLSILRACSLCSSLYTDVPATSLLIVDVSPKGINRTKSK